MDWKKAVVKGMLAGLAGGLVGGGMKLAGEWVYPPRVEGQVSPPALLAWKIAGRTLSKGQTKAAAQGMHWTFSAVTGAVYGGAAEVFPAVTAGYGVGLGMAVLLATHESVLPLLGLNAPPWRQPFREQTSEIATHALFGVSIEAVRRWLRRRARIR